MGLRINPQISYVEDKRYNPARKYSKLGVPLEEIIKILKNFPDRLEGINGIHFHANCESADFLQLLQTVQHLEANLGEMLEQISWINLGGGYYFDDTSDFAPFYEAIDLLKSKYALEVFIEPGTSIIQSAGFLVSEVIDLFDSDGKTLVVLDTTVNHLPEVFEYQYRPDVMNSNNKGKYSYILVGCSCLAGDLFGEYSFNERLIIGSRVVFSNVGSYSLVKSHMFNGINLPNIFTLNKENELILIKKFIYEDFLRNSCGEEKGENLRKRA